MKISVLGQQAHNTWFAGRLAQQGLRVEPGSLPRVLQQQLAQEQWSGLIVDGTLVDTGTSGLSARHQLAQACLQHGLPYAELAGPWLSVGTLFGFPLFTGSSLDTREQLRPLLDRLAPQPGAWLYCGPAGAGYFAARVFDAINHAGAQVLQNTWPQAGETLRPLAWEQLFTQQQELAARLRQLAELYLSFQPQEAERMPEQPFAAFNQPPAMQAHFSANLARLITLLQPHS